MEMTFAEAIRLAIDEEMSRDSRIILFGEDVATGGVFGVTRGLVERHGGARIRNTPISEAAITGMAVGAAVVGLRPVLEIMFIDFITLAMDGLVNQAAKYRYMSAGQLSVPMVVRTQIGAAGGGAAQHSQSLESWFAHIPGLIVVAPSNPVDAYGLLKSAIRSDDPVLFVEHKRLYSMRETWPESPVAVPLGKAQVVRPGSDATLITYSAMVRTALKVAEELEQENLSIEVIDLRSLSPLDIDTLKTSVAKTHRVLIAHEAVEAGGIGAEVAARLGQVAFDDLDAPIMRVGAPFVPLPLAPELEQSLLPGPLDLKQALLELLC